MHWNVPARGRRRTLADLLALCFLASRSRSSAGRACRATTAVLLGFFAAFLLVYLAGFYNLETAQALAQFSKGMVKFVIHFLFLAAAVAWLWRRGAALLLARARLVLRRHRASTPPTASCSSSSRAPAATSTRALALADHRRREQDQHLRRGRGREVFRPNALTGDPNHLGIMLIVPLLVLAPIYLRLERDHRAARPARGADRVPARRRARDALAQRPARPRASARSCSRSRTGTTSRSRALLVPARRSAGSARRGRRHALPLLRGRAPLAHRDGRRLASRRTSRSTTSSRRSCTPTRCSGSG